MTRLKVGLGVYVVCVLKVRRAVASLNKATSTLRVIVLDAVKFLDKVL